MDSFNMMNGCNPARMTQFGLNSYNGLNNAYMTNNGQISANNTLLRVNGLDGAKAFQMQPNQTIALFDSNEDIFYIKTSDAGGFSSINAYKFMRMEEVQPKADMSQFVTRQEFEELKEMLNNGKQSVRKQSATKQSDAEQ